MARAPGVHFHLSSLQMQNTTLKTTRTSLDVNKDGKISKSEFSQLDENKDGRVTHHEAADINDDGKVTHKEKNLLDANDDGKVDRHEILKAPQVDLDANGKATKKELNRVIHLMPPPPPLRTPPPPPPRLPPRTSWPVANRWNSVSEGIDEMVLVVVCLASLIQAVRWLARRVSIARGWKKSYQPVARVADAYGPDPGLELAERACDAVCEPQQPYTSASLVDESIFDELADAQQPDAVQRM